MAPKKSVKMDLGSFLADDSLGGGSWADGEIDMASIGVPVNNGSSAAPISSRKLAEANSFREENSFDQPRRERQEYPIPDHPPFRARVGNLPWEATEELLINYFESQLGGSNIVSDVKLPVDNNTNRLRGFGFLTFSSRETLEEGLKLSSAEFNGRRIYVDVAAPERQDVFDMDWRGGRGQGSQGPSRGPRREEPDLDWGSAKGSGVLPPRQPRGDRGDRPPRREEPDLDWGSAKGSGVLPPREPRGDRPPRKERVEPDLDWSSARGSGTLPPREPREPREDRAPRVRKAEPELDWGSARGSHALPPRQPRTTTNLNNTDKPKPSSDNFEWGKRGQALEPKSTGTNTRRSKPQEKEGEKKETKAQKSQFDVLRIDSDEEDNENDDNEEKELSEKVSDLSV